MAIVERGTRGQESRHEITGADEYILMVEHFADCALDGSPLRYGVDDAIANMAVIEALLRSAHADGRMVMVDAGISRTDPMPPP